MEHLIFFQLKRYLFAKLLEFAQKQQTNFSKDIRIQKVLTTNINSTFMQVLKFYAWQVNQCK